MKRSLLSLASLAVVISGCAITPPPLTDEEKKIRLDQNLECLATDPVPAGEVIDFHQALARVILNNLDARVDLMKKAVAEGTVDTALWDMAPKLTGKGNLSDRSNANASGSRSLTNGSYSNASSISGERTSKTWDLTMAFNLLDFGVSYLDAKQAGNRALIAEETRRRTVQGLIREVRGLYWQAVASEKVLRGLMETRKVLDEAHETFKKAREGGSLPIMAVVQAEKELYKSYADLQDLKAGLISPKKELAQLMGLPASLEFQLPLEMNFEGMAAPANEPLEGDALLQILANHPDMTEQAYLERIAEDDTTKTLVRLLPGIEISVSRNRDENLFLMNKDWYGAGANITWNVVNLFSGPEQYKLAKTKEELAQLETRAKTLVLISKARIAQAAYEESVESWELTRRRVAAETRYKEITNQTAAQVRGGKLQEFKAKLDESFAIFRRDLAYARVQASYGTLQQSLGRDPLDLVDASADLNTLTAALRTAEPIITNKPVLPDLKETPTPDGSSQSGASHGFTVFRNAHLRAEPAPDAEILTTLTPGQQVSFLNNSKWGWMEVSLEDGRKGWVASFLMAPMTTP